MALFLGQLGKTEAIFEVRHLCRVGGYNYGASLGGFGKFQLNMSFPLEIVAMFFFTLVLLLGVIHKRLRVDPSASHTSCGRYPAVPTPCLPLDDMQK